MPRYDSRTALVVVDVQNDFADPTGALYVQEGERVLPIVNHEIERAVKGGSTIIYTRDWHPPVTPHFAKDGGLWPVHCVQGSWGAQFHPDLLQVGGLQILTGANGDDGYSGFSSRHPVTGEISRTELESILRERAIERVILVGLATDYCVKETALDALRLGFETTVLVDATRPVDRAPGDGQRALNEIAALGGRLVLSGEPDPEFYESEPARL